MLKRLCCMGICSGSYSCCVFFLTCAEYDFLLVSSYSLREEFKTKKRPPQQKELAKLVYCVIDNWEKSDNSLVKTNTWKKMSHSPSYDVYKDFRVYCKRHNQGWLHNLWGPIQNENMRPWPQSPAPCKCSPIASLGRWQQWSSAGVPRWGPGNRELLTENLCGKQGGSLQTPSVCAMILLTSLKKHKFKNKIFKNFTMFPSTQ